MDGRLGINCLTHLRCYPIPNLWVCSAMVARDRQDDGAPAHSNWGYAKFVGNLRCSAIARNKPLAFSDLKIVVWEGGRGRIGQCRIVRFAQNGEDRL